MRRAGILLWPPEKMQALGFEGKKTLSRNFSYPLTDGEARFIRKKGHARPTRALVVTRGSEGRSLSSLKCLPLLPITESYFWVSDALG